VYPLREINGIEQYRITQKEVDWFHVQIVCDGSFPADGEDRIRSGWSQLMRTPLRVTFEYLSRIPPEPRGKFRHIVSEVDPAESPQREALTA
jgi:phenylacetate-CoA ligase